MASAVFRACHSLALAFSPSLFPNFFSLSLSLSLPSFFPYFVPWLDLWKWNLALRSLNYTSRMQNVEQPVSGCRRPSLAEQPGCPTATQHKQTKEREELASGQNRSANLSISPGPGKDLCEEKSHFDSVLQLTSNNAPPFQLHLSRNWCWDLKWLHNTNCSLSVALVSGWAGEISSSTVLHIRHQFGRLCFSLMLQWFVQTEWQVLWRGWWCPGSQCS